MNAESAAGLVTTTEMKRVRKQQTQSPTVTSQAAKPGPSVPKRRDRPASPPAPAVSTSALLVALLALAVYLNAIPGDFVFDDKLIQRDPRILGQTSFWTIFVTDYWYKYIGTSADLYRPLTIASYALNFAVTGLSSSAFHAVNIILHAAVCVLVVALVGALFRDRLLAVVSGLLFATHPVHTEAVTGIVGRAELLSALFLLGALWLHACRYRPWGWSGQVGLLVAVVAYFCALLSKETAIVGPGLLVLIDYAVARGEGDAPAEPFPGEADGSRPRSLARREPRPPMASDRITMPVGRPGWDLRRVLGIVALYATVAVIYVIIRYAVVGQLIQKPPPRSYLLLFGQPLVMRLCTALQILTINLRLLLFPATLSADYSYRQVPLIDTLTLPAAVGLLAAVLLCGGFVWAVRRRAWPAVFALGFFAVCYSLVSNLLVPLQILVAERLLYLPSVGFCVGAAWLWREWACRLGTHASASWLRHAPAAIVAAVVLLYSGRTVARNFDWRNNETLYAATVRASPECFAAHFNYSAILLRQPGKTQQALEELLKAYAIRQDHYPSLVNLSSAYLSTGQPDKAREIALHGLQIRPDGAELRRLLDAAEAQLHQRG